MIKTIFNYRNYEKYINYKKINFEIKIPLFLFQQVRESGDVLKNIRDLSFFLYGKQSKTSPVSTGDFYLEPFQCIHLFHCGGYNRAWHS
jgi:hypothetical protein